ncbi:MAG: holdfast anchor protein HfaD [Caulobacter sp.]|nr:holdfast anchor protein HfaD [Caulobacter sp.]
MCAMLVGAATSQTLPSAFQNDQTNIGAVTAEQTLDVVTADEGVAAASTAGGNTVGFTVNGADGAATSNQTNQGPIYAHTVVDASGSLGDSSNITTTAVGNSNTATAAYGTLSAFMVQTNYGSTTARGQIEAADAVAGDVIESTMAAGNSQGLLMVNGSMGARVSQNNQGDVLADGGAVIKYVAGTAVVAGTAAGNNIDLTGANASAARVITDQNNGAASVTAAKFTAYGNSYLTTTAATASGNNLNASNQGTLLDVTSHQYNTAYVRAQAEESSYQFGGAQATAYGVGNSAMAANYNGPGLVLDNVQVNDGGGVEVIASFTGDTGYDGGANATAIGNAVSGYACNQCSGNMSANNSQSNNVDVSARSTVSVTNSGRSITGIATATGNNATFSVTGR